MARYTRDPLTNELIEGRSLKWIRANTPRDGWWDFSRRTPAGHALLTQMTKVEGIPYNSAYVALRRALDLGILEKRGKSEYCWVHSNPHQIVVDKRVNQLVGDFWALSDAQRLAFQQLLGTCLQIGPVKVTLTDIEQTGGEIKLHTQLYISELGTHPTTWVIETGLSPQEAAAKKASDERFNRNLDEGMKEHYGTKTITTTTASKSHPSASSIPENDDLTPEDLARLAEADAWDKQLLESL
jgi:hypothetical protein